MSVVGSIKRTTANKNQIIYRVFPVIRSVLKSQLDIIQSIKYLLPVNFIKTIT